MLRQWLCRWPVTAERWTPKRDLQIFVIPEMRFVVMNEQTMMLILTPVPP